MNSFQWQAEEEMLDSELKDLQLVTIYMLSTGRNAWNSTWSAKYSHSAALYASFDAAKAAAEVERKMGTTFKIRQIPGIALISIKGVIVFVEFHSEEAFARLKIEQINDNIHIGTPVSVAMKPFMKATEDFWNGPFPSESSFTSAKTDLSEVFEMLSPPNTQLKQWGSVANGSNYYLGWHEKNPQPTSPIWKIYEKFQEENSAAILSRPDEDLEMARGLAVRSREKIKNEAAVRALMENIFNREGKVGD